MAAADLKHFFYQPIINELPDCYLELQIEVSFVALVVTLVNVALVGFILLRPFRFLHLLLRLRTRLGVRG